MRIFEYCYSRSANVSLFYRRILQSNKTKITFQKNRYFKVNNRTISVKHANDIVKHLEIEKDIIFFLHDIPFINMKYEYHFHFKLYTFKNI